MKKTFLVASCILMLSTFALADGSSLFLKAHLKWALIFEFFTFIGK